jgi:hypothetical protein
MARSLLRKFLIANAMQRGRTPEIPPSAQGLPLQSGSLRTLMVAHSRIALWCLFGAGIAGSLAGVWVLRAFPNSGDEYNYLFQAKTFLAGRLWNPEPPLSDLFSFFHVSFRSGKWFTQYPPGWPLLLALVTGLRLPAWLACPLAGGVLLFALFELGQRRDGALGGVLAVALVALSPFFMFNAGSYFNHVPSAAAGLLFCWAATAFLDRPRTSNALLAGAALGMLGLIRPLDALLFALPFFVECCWRARRRHYHNMPIVIIGGLPFLAGLLLYYYAMNGSVMPGPSEASPVKFGLFGVDEAGNHLMPLDELQLVPIRHAGRMDFAIARVWVCSSAGLAWLPEAAELYRFRISALRYRLFSRPLHWRQSVRSTLLFRSLAFFGADGYLGLNAAATG